MDLMVGFASFVGVFFKVLQGRNFNYNNYFWVMPTSIALAAVDLYIVNNIVTHGYSLALIITVGIGSGLGGMAAMYIHEQVIKRKPKDDQSLG
jgi:hypothetical protein